MRERWQTWAARNRANLATSTGVLAVGAVAAVGLFAAFDDVAKSSEPQVIDRSQEVRFLGATTNGKWVKRSLRVQDARVSGNRVQVSGKVVSKQDFCLKGLVGLYRTDAAGTILGGPVGGDETNKKGAWSLLGPTAVTVTSADRFVVRIKKGILEKTKKGKFNCVKATSAPFAPFIPPGTVPPGAQPPTGTQPPPGGSNQSPYFPSQTTTVTQDNDYAVVLGQPCLISQTLNITISPGATDPDGDPLTYSWTASNGTINGTGLSASWQRVVQNCSPVPGTVTVTASDGRGGTAQIQKTFN